MEKEIFNIIAMSWSKETCCPALKENWNESNPSLGQFAVTSLIVNDLFGGKIMRCMVNGSSHYYNLINNNIVDITVSQFLGVLPDYNLGEERTREYLLSNEDTKKRYYKLLKNVYNYLCGITFESINSDERIDKKFFNNIFIMSTFEIDDYYNCNEYEKVKFDLAGQNTGNIFEYIYYKESKKYELVKEPMLFTMKIDNYIIPTYILDQIFDVARDNSNRISLLKKLNSK